MNKKNKFDSNQTIEKYKKVQGRNCVENKKESYEDMGIQYWEMSTFLQQRILSTGECERNELLGLYSSKRFRSVRLAELQATVEVNKGRKTRSQ